MWHDSSLTHISGWSCNTLWRSATLCNNNAPVHKTPRGPLSKVGAVEFVVRSHLLSCSEFQCVAVCYNHCVEVECVVCSQVSVVVYCGVLQVLQWDAVWQWLYCSEIWRRLLPAVLKRVAGCCSVAQCVPVCCSVLQCLQRAPMTVLR